MSCYHVADDQPRYLRNRHEDDCPATTWHPPLARPECAGCQVCERRHCLIQWHGDRGDCMTHAESVCPSCVGKVREHLTEIVRLSGLPLLEQVLSKGSVDTEAADLLGPVADQAQWRSRIEQGAIHDPETLLGGNHPLWVLGRWDMEVTEHLGHRRTRKVKIRSAAAYLDSNLTWLAVDPSFDIALFAAQVADCRSHLEHVVHEGEQIETGAPCMTCRVPLRLVRTTGEDRWTCPRCRERSTESQYHFALRADFVDNSPLLNADDMATRTGVPSSSVRAWANVVRVQADGEAPEDLPPLLRPAGRMHGRIVYRVADVEAIRAAGGDTRRKVWRATRTTRPA